MEWILKKKEVDKYLFDPLVLNVRSVFQTNFYAPEKLSALNVNSILQSCC